MISRIAPRISLATRALPRAATAARMPRVAVPARTFTLTPVRLGQEWHDKGPITYEELKPLTEQPTGVRTS